MYAIGKLRLATVLAGLAAAPIALTSDAGPAPPPPLAHDHSSHSHAGLTPPDVKSVGEISHQATPAGLRAAPRNAPLVSASWAFRPRTVDELAARSSVVVEAEVVGVRRGAPLWPHGDDPHATAIPTQRIDVSVVDGLRGGVAAGDELTLFRTGGETGGRVLSLEGDPPYRQGERYVLFLEPRGDGTYIPPAPDGRLRLDEGGRAVPLIEGPVGEAVAGMTTTSVARAARKG